MTVITPSGGTLGATVTGIDLAQPLSDADFALILRGLGAHGVLCFPRQTIDAVAQKNFAGRFGELEVNVANWFQEPGHPEVMILSNMVENGKPVGVLDAGQDWHTDMSYSHTIAFANVLYGLRIPHRDGRPLGATQFANMHAAYDALPDELKTRLSGMTVLHDFNKMWEHMRKREGSPRPPLTPEQLRQKPPVSHQIFLKHPITGREVLYANPGYAMRINELPERESDEMLEFLFAHQMSPRFYYAHHWTRYDVLMWDNIGTLHCAAPDYGPTEHRLIKRCQVAADRIFDPDFRRALLN